MYTLGQKKRNSDKSEQLGIFNINGKLTQYKINWRVHIQRMDENRLPKKNNYKPEGRRNIGRRLGDDFREGGRNRPRGLSLIVDDDGFLWFLGNSFSKKKIS